jgi:hypothetical protein
MSAAVARQSIAQPDPIKRCPISHDRLTYDETIERRLGAPLRHKQIPRIRTVQARVAELLRPGTGL